MAVNPNEWPLMTFLAWTCSIINRDGFLSRKDRRNKEKATVDKVLYFLVPPDDSSGRYTELGNPWRGEYELYRPCSTNLQEARAVRDWALGLTEEDMDKSSFHHNVNQIAKNGVVQRRVAGIAAAMVSAYRKSREKQRTN